MKKNCGSQRHCQRMLGCTKPKLGAGSAAGLTLPNLAHATRWVCSLAPKQQKLDDSREAAYLALNPSDLKRWLI